MTQTIISLTGMIGSGKDTAADYLCEAWGFKRIAFAEALKDVVATLFGLDRDMLEGRTWVERAERMRVLPFWDAALSTDHEVTPRWLLQVVGTEIFREFDPDIWVNALAVRLADRGPRVVVTDTRFFNEMRMLRERQAVLCAIHRKLPRWLPQFYAGLEDHGFHPGNVESTTPGALQAARVTLRNLGLQVHVSEWQHLLWTDYDHVIDNTKSLKHLHRQLNVIAVNAIKANEPQPT